MPETWRCSALSSHANISRKDMLCLRRWGPGCAAARSAGVTTRAPRSLAPTPPPAARATHTECSAAASTSARVTDHTFRVFPSRLTPSATRLSLLLAATCKASTLEWRRTPKRRLCAFCHARRDAKSALRAATHASAPITLRLNEQDSKKTRQRVCIVSRRRRVLCRCACCLSFFVKRFNSACTWLQR